MDKRKGKKQKSKRTMKNLNYELEDVEYPFINFNKANDEQKKEAET